MKENKILTFLIKAFILLNLLKIYSAAKTRVALNSNNISLCTGNHCEISLDTTVSLEQPQGELLVEDPFRNIGYNLSLSSAVASFRLYSREQFPVVDSTSADQVSCMCPVNNLEITDNPCTRTPLVPNLDITFNMRVDPLPPNDCDPTQRAARCCYIVKVWSNDYYHVYSGLSANFENLKITYHNIDFRLNYGTTKPLIDLNVTMLGMTYDLLPLDSVALVMDIYGKARLVDRNLINYPGEYDGTKAGWWKQDIDKAKNNFPQEQMPINLQAKSQQFQSRLNLTQLKRIPDFANISVTPIFESTPGEKILSTRIVYQTSPTILTYSYSTTNPGYFNATLNVDNQLMLVCVSYPYICICSPDPSATTFNPQKRCIGYRGKLLIQTPSQSLHYAFLDGQSLLVDAHSNLLAFMFEIRPTKTDLRITSNVNIPAITLTEVEQVDIALFNLSSVTYAMFNCSQYPSSFVVETDLKSYYFIINSPGIMMDIRWAVPIFKIVDRNGPRLQTILKPISTVHPSSPVTTTSNSGFSILKKIFTNLYFWISLVCWIPFWIITTRKKVLTPNIFGLSILAALFFFQLFWILIPCFLIYVAWQSHKRENLQREETLQEQFGQHQDGSDFEMEEYSVVDYAPPPAHMSSSARRQHFTPPPGYSDDYAPPPSQMPSSTRRQQYFTPPQDYHHHHLSHHQQQQQQQQQQQPPQRMPPSPRYQQQQQQRLPSPIGRQQHRTLNFEFRQPQHPNDLKFG